jgi:hypothetical protein
MSLTSYQAAPPRVFTYADGDRESKLKKRSLVRSISGIKELAPGVGSATQRSTIREAARTNRCEAWQSLRRTEAAQRHAHGGTVSRRGMASCANSRDNAANVIVALGSSNVI